MEPVILCSESQVDYCSSISVHNFRLLRRETEFKVSPISKNAKYRGRRVRILDIFLLSITLNIDTEPACQA
jgi:hypothetical protein